MLKRIEEIETEAMRAFCEQSNHWDIFDWLDDKTRLEFERLQYAVGDSKYNPDEDNSKENPEWKKQRKLVGM